MRKLLLTIAALFLAPLSMSAQSQTFWVASASGTTLSDKITNAMTACTSQAPCTILINSYFPIISGESLPAPCANCTFRDYRAANLGNAATMNVGTTAGTVAAGDDSRIVYATIPSGLVMFVDGTISACPSGYTQTAGVPTFAGGAGTVPAETFTGSALGTHTHTLTPAGTNSVPAFTGTGATLTPTYLKLIPCRKT